MATIALVNGYLAANAVIVGAVLATAAMRALNRRLARPFSHRDVLGLAYVMSAAIVLLPLGALLTDHEPVVPHAAEVWSAATMHDGERHAATNHQIEIVVGPERPVFQLGVAMRVAGWVFALGVISMLLLIVVDAAKVSMVIANAAQLRRRHRIRMLASDHAAVPFSFWIPGRHFIVIPSGLIARPLDLRIAIEHEGQHHRQADTKILHAYQLLRALCWWNPAAHLLTHQIRELQEFACDEAVLRRRQRSTRDYCGCLLWVAESARSRSLLTAAMASKGRSVLMRRIDSALNPPTSYRKGREVVLAALIAVSFLAILTSAIAAPIQDRRISAAEAESMAQIARASSTFPIAMNDRVLEQLNLLLGTPDGRAHLRASLARMRQYEAMILEQIQRYELPDELLAVPLVEAGYRNLPQGRDARHGAGLWMFIASTARKFGLIVTPTEDQRLDEALETDAAMRMLAELHSRFGNWELALLAFNGGERRVERGIRATGSNNAWTLVESGYENDADYLARVMAAIVIIKNHGAQVASRR